MNKIREHRKQRKWTQEALAQRLGVERSAVAKWESGKTSPRPRTSWRWQRFSVARWTRFWEEAGNINIKHRPSSPSSIRL